MSNARPQRLQALDATHRHHSSSGGSASDLSHLLKLQHTASSPIEGEEAQSASSSVTSSPTLSSSIAGVSTGLNPTFDESISVRRHMVAGTSSHPNLRELSRNKLNTNITMRGVAADDISSPTSSVSPSDTLLTRIPVVGGNVSNIPASPLGPHESHLSLRTPRNDWKVFDQGMRFGCMLLLLTWVMWDCIVDARLRPADQDLWVQLILPVYRGMGCLLLLGWCLGFSLYMWEKYHINYGFLMEVDLRTFLTATEVLDACVNATILYLANFLIYFKIMRGDFPNWIQAGYFPMAYLGWLLWKLLPWSHWFCNKPSRMSVVWASLVQVALAPFGKVTFLTGYLGDIWTSMVKVSVDLAYAGCLFVSGDWMVEIETLALTQNQNNAAANAAANLANSALNAATNSDGVIPGTTPVVLPSSAGDLNKIDTCFQSMFFKSALIPLLSALPLWLRFMQCLKRYVNTRKRWPHIGNACKYALAHSVILFGVYNSSTFQSAEATQNLYKASWILCMILSTLYTFAWDVFMDWGLGNMKFGGLREELMFPHRWVYYLAIVVDLFARFAWTLTLIPQGEDSPFSPDFVLYLQPTLAAGEILRRTMWGLFRLEWEHLSTQSYHRVPDAVAQAAPLPEMSGYKIIMEVSVLVVIVLSIGTTAALTAN